MSGSARRSAFVAACAALSIFAAGVAIGHGRSRGLATPGEIRVGSRLAVTYPDGWHTDPSEDHPMPSYKSVSLRVYRDRFGSAPGRVAKPIWTLSIGDNVYYATDE